MTVKEFRSYCKKEIIKARALAALAPNKELREKHRKRAERLKAHEKNLQTIDARFSSSYERRSFGSGCLNVN